jgi:hypothetical protein
MYFKLVICKPKKVFQYQFCKCLLQANISHTKCMVYLRAKLYIPTASHSSTVTIKIKPKNICAWLPTFYATFHKILPWQKFNTSPQYTTIHSFRTVHLEPKFFMAIMLLLFTIQNFKMQHLFTSYCEYQLNGSEILNLNGHTKTPRQQSQEFTFFTHTHKHKHTHTHTHTNTHTHTHNERK